MPKQGGNTWKNSSSLTDVVDIWREEEYFFIDNSLRRASCAPIFFATLPRHMRSRGEQIAPMVLLVTLSRCPSFYLERCHNAMPPTGRWALAGSRTRPDFLRDTAASPATTLRLTPQRVLAAAAHALPRRADRAHGFVGDTVAMPPFLSRTMPQRDAPHR